MRLRILHLKTEAMTPRNLNEGAFDSLAKCYNPMPVGACGMLSTRTGHDFMFVFAYADEFKGPGPNVATVTASRMH
jgi:hypothetical protein